MIPMLLMKSARKTASVKLFYFQGTGLYSRDAFALSRVQDDREQKLSTVCPSYHKAFQLGF